MNTKRMTADFRKRLKKRKQQITDQELFLSEAYRAPLWRLAKALGQKASITLSVFYDEDPTSQAAFTNGKEITLNAGNVISGSFFSREEKIVSHEGLIAHECGHICCSDFHRLSHYVSGFQEGLCYPAVPEQKDRADRKAWAEMKEYLTQKNPTAVFWIKKTAVHLHNILEDVYIEAYMCREYPGTVRSSIQKNAQVVIRKIPTLQERNAADSSELDIMMDLIFRYARAGQTPEETKYPKRYQTCLNRCKSWIDVSVRKENPDIRFHASNQILLKIWPYLKKVICDTNAQIEQEKIRLEQIQEWLDSHWKAKICWVSLSEAGTGEKILAAAPEGWNGSLEKKQVSHECESERKPAGQTPDTELSTSDERANTQEAAEETVKPEESDRWNILEELPEILNQLAGYMEAREEEKKRKRDLQQELKDIPQSKIHAKCHYQLHREVDISEKTLLRYLEIEKESRQTAKRLIKLAEDILQQREGDILKSLYLGKRLSRGELYRRDGKIFEKKLLPDEGPSLAFAVLVDVSGSMEGKRIENARKAALALYWFCEELNIPVLVYGHSTHNTYRFSTGEVVDLCSYAEFDAIDGNDALRIAGMETIDCNRDGAALRYVGERLLKRDEDVKILVLISDGQPNANGYAGELARKDLVETKHNLEKRGIHLFAAAIGADKEQIERIYQNGFLNISDLKTMPVKLTKLLMAYLR